MGIAPGCVVRPPVWISPARSPRFATQHTGRRTATHLPSRGPRVRGLHDQASRDLRKLARRAPGGRTVQRQEPRQPTATSRAISGRLRETKLLCHPAPEWTEQLALPALERLPASRLPSIRKALADLRRRLVTQQREHQAQQDRYRRVPPPWIQRVRQHADRPSTPPAQKPADPHHQIPAFADQPQRLSLVGPMPHDLQPVARRPRQLLAQRAALRPLLLDRRKPTPLGQVLDGNRKRAYDHDHLMVEDGELLAAKKRGLVVLAPFLLSQGRWHSPTECATAGTLLPLSPRCTLSRSVRMSPGLRIHLSHGSPAGNLLRSLDQRAA